MCTPFTPHTYKQIYIETCVMFPLSQKSVLLSQKSVLLSQKSVLLSLSQRSTYTLQTCIVETNPHITDLCGFVSLSYKFDFVSLLEKHIHMTDTKHVHITDIHMTDIHIIDMKDTYT